MLSNDQVEDLAKLTHDAYLRRLKSVPADGETPPSEPARRPWNELAEIYRRQNRDQVCRIRDWLCDSGWTIVDHNDARQGATFNPIDDDLLEKFGQYEHRRWMQLKYWDGWTAGPRDDSRKTHPCLVAWVDLPESEKAKDRAPLKEFSDHLSGFGLRIVRAESEA